MYKRFEMRRSLGIPIEVITSNWDDPIDLMASNLSPRGAYVESEFLPESGEHIVCSFALNGKFPYCFFGEVCRVNFFRRRTETGRPGFGVSFLDASPMERLRIRHSLKGLPPPVPSPWRLGEERRKPDISQKNKRRLQELSWLAQREQLVIPAHFPHLPRQDRLLRNPTENQNDHQLISGIGSLDQPPVLIRPIIRV